MCFMFIFYFEKQVVFLKKNYVVDLMSSQVFLGFSPLCLSRVSYFFQGSYDFLKGFPTVLCKRKEAIDATDSELR